MKDDKIKDIERCFLGSLLIAGEKGEITNTRLKADDFKFTPYGHIYKTILKQQGAGITPTIVTLHNELPDIPASDIAELTNAVPSSVNIAYYEDQIYEASKIRYFIKALNIAKEDIDSGTDADTIIKNLIPALSDVTNAKNETGIITAAELLEKEFPPQKWIIPGLIGGGLIMLAGPPKIGKSWFVLQLAAAAASGCYFLDAWASLTGTLYISLEDTERRLQSRMKILDAPAINELKVTTQWKDGYFGIDNYLEKNPDIGLVIIDTLARFANIEDMNDYAITTDALARLKAIADKREVTILVVHHARKGENRQGIKNDPVEATLGSTGLTGTVDSTITLFRHRSSDKVNHEGALYTTGRDAPDELRKLTLDIKNGGWSVRQDKNDPRPKPENSGALGENKSESNKPKVYTGGSND